MSQAADSSILDATSSELVATNGNGQLASGINRLSQVVLIELLTKIGSVKFQPEKGTPFLNILAANSTYSEYDVFTAVTVAGLHLKTKLKKTETTDTPDDEKLKRLGLEKIVVFPGVLVLTLIITAESGDYRKLITAVEVL